MFSICSMVRCSSRSCEIDRTTSSTSFFSTSVHPRGACTMVSAVQTVELRRTIGTSMVCGGSCIPSTCFEIVCTCVSSSGRNHRRLPFLHTSINSFPDTFSSSVSHHSRIEHHILFSASTSRSSLLTLTQSAMSRLCFLIEINTSLRKDFTHIRFGSWSYPLKPIGPMFLENPKSDNHAQVSWSRSSTRCPHPHLGNSLPHAPSGQFRTETASFSSVKVVKLDLSWADTFKFFSQTSSLASTRFSTCCLVLQPSRSSRSRSRSCSGCFQVLRADSIAVATAVRSHPPRVARGVLGTCSPAVCTALLSRVLGSLPWLFLHGFLGPFPGCLFTFHVVTLPLLSELVSLLTPWLKASSLSVALLSYSATLF